MRKRERGAFGESWASMPSDVSSVDTAYVRNMALQAQAAAAGHMASNELPPELKMAADALRLRLHGPTAQGGTDLQVVPPRAFGGHRYDSQMDEYGRYQAIQGRRHRGAGATDLVSVERARPVDRATSTRLQQYGYNNVMHASNNMYGPKPLHIHDFMGAPPQGGALVLRPVLGSFITHGVVIAISFFKIKIARSTR